MSLPEYLKQGERARLFPVLSTTSKEGRTTSVLLACLTGIFELSRELLGSVGQRVGTRATIETYAEIVFSGERAVKGDRPDGLIVLRTGRKEWKALVETKVANARLDADQIERYRALAKEHGIDCVITISNQFATNPQVHPLQAVRKSRSRVPVFHWSWMFILTAAHLLQTNDLVEDSDQGLILEELIRFLSHESAGVKGFDRIPAEWSELNRLVSAGGSIPARSEEASTVLAAWHQETKDLSLVLSRLTDASVSERLPRSHQHDARLRERASLDQLRTMHQLAAVFDIPDAAAPLEVTADLVRRTVDVGMSLRAPEDRVSSKARLNWLLRQIKTENTDDLHIRLRWPGRSEDTQFSYAQLASDPSLCEDGKSGLQVREFHVFFAKRLGARFTQQQNFIADLEVIVPAFYREVGQALVAWRKPAPTIKAALPEEAHDTSEADPE